MIFISFNIKVKDMWVDVNVYCLFIFVCMLDI